MDTPYLFYRDASTPETGGGAPDDEPSLPEGYAWDVWRPGGGAVLPPGGPISPFLVWWAFHILRIFWNRDYFVVSILHEGSAVHRSCVFPGYFRFPFMARADLQVGDTWTAPSYQGKGLATLGLAMALRQASNAGRRVWYLVEKDNGASIRVAEKMGMKLVAKGARTKRLGLGVLGCYVPSEPVSDDALSKSPRIGAYGMVKRLGDFCLACFLLTVLGPGMLLIGLLIRLTSPGAALYLGERGAMGGATFRIMKFRSMVVDAEALGGSSTAGTDVRITPIGSVLRAFKIDEFPQFLNVLKGEMSFVGPRPEVMQYVSMYTDEEKAILDIRPGITDWASIWNSDEGAVLKDAEDPDEAFEELIRPTKVALQLKYRRELSLGVDLRILFSTAVRLVRSTWMPRELEPYGRLVP